MNRKNRIRFILFCASWLFALNPLFAQFVDYGSDPARLKWQQVRTQHYKLIFPKENEAMARRYAFLLEEAYPHVAANMQTKRYFTHPVILHPYNMQSNGMVAWAPRRMELLTTPSSTLFAQSWDRQLAVHESRHVLQTSKQMQGIFYPLYWLIGEQAAGLAAVFIPKWFWEGDAVVAETALSSSGRGRLPEFNMTYRAQVMSGKNYSFDKWYMGSYKNYTGDYYSLGYHIVSYGRQKYGADLWDRVVDRYLRRFLLIPPFSNALKYHTGMKSNGLFRETFDYLSTDWRKLDDAYFQSDEAKEQPLTSEHKRYTSYRYPQMLGDKTILAVKSSLDDLNSLVMLDGTCEMRITYLGSINSRIILNNSRVYWTENVSGLRWTHENHSVVKYYDFLQGRVKTLTPGKRYLAPAVSADGQTIAVLRPDPDGKNYVALLQVLDGAERKAYATPANAYIKDMVFMDEDRLACIAVDDQGISLLQLNLETSRWRRLLGPTSANITSLCWRSDKLFFESGLNGTNNIYFLDPDDRKSYRLTNARFGAFDPTFTLNGKQLVFSNYQASGYEIASLPVDELEAVPADFAKPHEFELAQTISRQEAFNLDTVKIASVPFEPKPYRKLTHLFNFHSWAPFYYNVADAMSMTTDDLKSIVKPGVMVLSQNHLNTAVTQLGWYYDFDRKQHHGKLSFVYTGLFPVLELDVDYGGQAYNVVWEKQPAEEEGEEDLLLPVSRKDGMLIDAHAKIYLPFNLTRNHMIRGFQPSLTYYYTNNGYQQINTGKIKDFQYLMSELRYYSYRRMARTEILPRWGYQIRLQHVQNLMDDVNFGAMYAARLITYLPGIVRGNSLMLRAGYQYQDLSKATYYIPVQIIDNPRGISTVRSSQQVSLKADYAFSLFCPDFSIGSLAYIKRFRTNLFYDISMYQIRRNGAWTSLSSAGVDLIFDWHVLRSSFPLSAGVRLIQPIDEGKFKAEALFSVSF